jgi:hypothetical protein
MVGRSLDRATRLAAAHPDHAESIVCFSDFQLFDPDVPAVFERFVSDPAVSTRWCSARRRRPRSKTTTA